LLEEFFADKTTPAFANLPRSTWITDVGAFECNLQLTFHITSCTHSVWLLWPAVLCCYWTERTSA